MAGEVIATIRNVHVEGCGTPPSLDLSDYNRSSYFQNEHGEQSLFLFDEEAGLTVYSGDMGWDNPLEVPTRELENKDTEDLLAIWRQALTPEEETWMKACLQSVQLYL